MSVDIVSAEMLVDQKQEHVVLMDDYGMGYHAYIPVTRAAERQQIIQEKVSLLESNQAAMESYAALHGHDLSTQKAAGLAKKNALIAKNKPVPFVVSPAPATSASSAAVPSSAPAATAAVPAVPTSKK